jgi:hypothetical protein
MRPPHPWPIQSRPPASARARGAETGAVEILGETSASVVVSILLMALDPLSAT